MLGVVLAPEAFEQHAGALQAPELVFVEALVAQSAVELLAEAVLPGLAGCDVEGVGPALLEPVDDLGGDELAAVVRPHNRRSSMPLEELREDGLYGARRDRARPVHGERHARELVDHGGTFSVRPEETAS